MLPQQTTVLVVGAGPTGLAAATSLAFQGCKDLVIVDAVERNMRPLSSRALAIHAATLETLDAIQVTDDLIDHGYKASYAHIYTSYGPLARTDFDSLKGHTRYPYVILASQYTTERILEKKAEEQGIKVERPYQLVGLSDHHEFVVATFDNGEKIKAKYVIAADGARSTVRQLVNVGFADPDGASTNDKDVLQMAMADVTFASTPARMTRDQFFGYASGSGFCFSIPVPRSRFPESYESTADNIFRIGINVPKEDGQPPPMPDVDYFQRYLDKIRPTFMYTNEGGLGQSTVKIDKMLWSTRFRTNAAIADQFLVKLHAHKDSNPRVVFFIGDAAHIHSPVGGQGMNLGIREAVLLTPVLVKHMEVFPQDPSSADKLLEEFASTRYARAISTIRLTKRSMGMIASLAAMTGGWGRYLTWIVSLVLKLPFVSAAIVWEMSGLGRV